MENWQRTKALWTHRYKKYTHILRKYQYFLADYLKLSNLKRSLKPGQKLVVIMLSEQLGDIVACEPVSREVRRRHPDDYILWMVRKPFEDLVKYNPHLNGYWTETCSSHRDRLLESGVFDKVYDLHLSHRNCRYCRDDHVNPNADRLNITYANYYDHGDLLYIFSQAAGLPALDESPRVYIPQESVRKVDSLNIPPRAIVIHAQSSYAPRDWQVAHWHRLLDWIFQNYPHHVIEVGLSSQLTIKHPRYLNLCGKLTILETAEVIRRASLYIGVDSGPAHLANAAGTPGVILLGRTANFDEYMPYSGNYKHGRNVTILNNVGHTCSELPYEWVQQAVELKLNQPVTHE